MRFPHVRSRGEDEAGAEFDGTAEADANSGIGAGEQVYVGEVRAGDVGGV